MNSNAPASAGRCANWCARKKAPFSCAWLPDKDELLVEYATYQLDSQLFVQRYPLYLPDREELRRELELTLLEAGQ